MKSNDKEEAKTFSDILDVALAKIVLEGGRLFHRVVDYSTGW